MIQNFRFAIVKKDKCNPNSCGNLCIKLCPINRTGEPCILKTDDGKIRIDEVLCTGCGICANRCPFNAISIIKLPKPPNKKPIHRYGENAFSLFGLISPIFNRVIGIIGRNGIGKSTALNILSGIIKPNFGQLDINYDTKEYKKKLFDFFKGTESQLFFKKLINNNIKVSYKPQAIEKICKNHDGTVFDLLKKNDDKNKLNETCKSLGITGILENNLSEISGGELQKVAIAMASLKKADLYLFDEPSAYLDVSERLKISEFIRKLASPVTAVVVVDHDLIVQDYLSDLIIIMYGKQTAYGVVSNVMNARNGINAFLNGYLKSENVQFRNYKISYENLKDNLKKESIPIIQWNNIHKKLGHFELTADHGSINEKDIIGVVGKNGIGKTTFMKILAKIIKIDNGTLSENVKISYKPQQILPNSTIVKKLFNDVGNDLNNMVLKPMNIDLLYDEHLNNLSGGELQKVAIAYALSQKADIYLLDEPSAYLDVEERLNIAKIIKNYINYISKAALIVDHDLMFLDYFSEKIIVFQGKPAISGKAMGPFEKHVGMNLFLKDLEITFRRDVDSKRPKANKIGSKIDVLQKEKGEYFY